MRLFERPPTVGHGGEGASTLDDAVRGGLGADRLGVAFLAGYAAALRALVPGLRGPAALCATEAGGGHPRAILCRVADGKLAGTKTFVTGGAQAERLLVVAREDTGTLRVVVVDAHAPGVTLTPLPPMAFAPEIPHASLLLDGAPGEVLPGDGYDDYLKPFRTVEDIHVMLAAAAYLVGLGRRASFAPSVLASLAAVVAALTALGQEPRLAPATHVALAGTLDHFRGIVERLELAGAPEDERARWERDRPLLGIAGKVRELRFASACAALGLVGT